MAGDTGAEEILACLTEASLKKKEALTHLEE